MPGTMLPGWKATCSVSAKKLSGFRLSIMRPMISTGRTSSGISLVASSTSKSKSSASSSLKDWMPKSNSGKSPLAIAS